MPTGSCIEAGVPEVYRAVLDPGVLIAALISSKGAPRELLLAWLNAEFELVICPALLAELERVLLRAKFRPYVTAAEVRAYVVVIRRLGELWPDPIYQAGLTPDPADDYLVALALAAAAHFLVSGDSHLHRLKAPEPKVLTPRGFLKVIAGS